MINMRRRKRSYYYSYGNRSKRSRLRLDRIAIVAVVTVLVLGVIVFLNYHRIRLMLKGYSFASTGEILDLPRSHQEEILSYDKLDHITDWIALSNEVEYYDEYERYLALYPDMDLQDVTEFINHCYEEYAPSLKTLGFDEESLWTLVSMASLDDLAYLVDHDIDYTRIEPYLSMDGFVVSNILDYEEAYATHHDYGYALNSVNYPFIISKNDNNASYTIANPEDIDILVKKGFYLPSDYEPSDLVDPKELGMAVSDNSNGYLIRQEAAEALKEMFEDAAKVGYHLVVNSAYRSYAMQVDTYESFETMYGGQYASEYVALPGASEHQTGLGIDLTSQSVLEGTYNVFGDTPDYLWVVQNCYKYGFIMRFEDDKADITGIAHEPWHVRYVGKDVAEVIHEEGYTFEEYCLYHGNIPELED